MIADGWVDETRGLLDRFGRLSRTAAESTGYRELIDHIEGKSSLDDAVEQIRNVRAERRYPAAILDELESMGHPVSRTIPFNGLLGHAHAIELVDGGPANRDGSLAAATDPRSAGLPAVW